MFDAFTANPMTGLILASLIGAAVSGPMLVRHYAERRGRVFYVVDELKLSGFDNMKYVEEMARQGGVFDNDSGLIRYYDGLTFKIERPRACDHIVIARTQNHYVIPYGHYKPHYVGRIDVANLAAHAVADTGREVAYLDGVERDFIRFAVHYPHNLRYKPRA